MAISLKTLKALFAKSGNRCAFTGCNYELVDKDNIIMGQIAHIEAKDPGGARYNSSQTDTERNSYENLICLCPNHHTLIDKKEKVYTVDILKEMKAKHEYEFRNSKCEFDYSKIYEANIELRSFLEEVDTKSRIYPYDMAIPIKKDDSFTILVETLYTNIDFFEKTSLEFLDFSKSLNDKIIEQMEKLGYDTSEWKKVPYYENPFVNVFWDTLAIGYGNTVKISRLKLKQMEVLYYTEFLKYNKDAEINKRLEKVKKELFEAAGNEIYED